MDNLKKVGLTALAGSLAMFSVSQADITVGGSGEVTYVSEGGDEVNSGNPYGVSHTISFTGTGELDNGIGYKFYTEMAGVDMTADSSYVQFDAGDMGKFGIDQGVGQYGIGTIALSIPTAYEEADHAVGSLADGLDNTGDVQTLGYIGDWLGANINIEYNPAHGNLVKSQAGGNSSASPKTGTNLNWAVKYAVPGADGLELRLGASNTDFAASTATDDQEITGAVKYAIGAVSLGYQMSEIQSGTAGTAGENVRAYGVAFNVNDNLSISYGRNENESDPTAGGTNVTEKSTGIQAAYTMGSASLRIAHNEATGVGAVAAAKDENLEISMSLSF